MRLAPPNKRMNFRFRLQNGLSLKVSLNRARKRDIRWHILAPLSARGWWRGLDSNQRTLARADLQSAAFNHSATSPGGLGLDRHRRSKAGGVNQGANNRSRPMAGHRDAVNRARSDG